MDFGFDTGFTERGGQEVKIAALRGLFDVLQIQMSIATRVAWPRLDPRRPSLSEFILAVIGPDRGDRPGVRWRDFLEHVQYRRVVRNRNGEEVGVAGVAKLQ